MRQNLWNIDRMRNKSLWIRNGLVSVQAALVNKCLLTMRALKLPRLGEPIGISPKTQRPCYGDVFEHDIALVVALQVLHSLKYTDLPVHHRSRGW